MIKQTIELNNRLADILSAHEHQCRHDRIDRSSTQPWAYVEQILEAVNKAAEEQSVLYPLVKVLDKVKAARAYLWHYDYGAGLKSDLDNAIARLDEFLGVSGA